MTCHFSNGPNSIRNGARNDQNGEGYIMVAADENKPKEGPLKPFSDFQPNYAIITLPLFTASEGNGGVKKSALVNGRRIYKNEHWSEKQKRHKMQQKFIALMLNPIRKNIALPCKIKLTRYAPRKLDRHDNLPMSMKYVLDAICAIIKQDFRPGRADDDERISVTYDQVACPDYGVKVEFFF